MKNIIILIACFFYLSATGQEFSDSVWNDLSFRHKGRMKTSEYVIQGSYTSKPEYIAFHEESVFLKQYRTYASLTRFDLWLVEKDGQYGVINMGKLIVPCEFFKEDLRYEGEGVFTIFRNGNETEILDVLNNVNLNIRSKLNSPAYEWDLSSFHYDYVSPSKVIDSTDHISVASLLHISQSPDKYYPTSSPEKLSNHLIVIKRNSGEVLKEYKKSDCLYTIASREFIAEIEFKNKRRGNVKINLYSIQTGEYVHSYRLNPASLTLLENLTKSDGGGVYLRTEKLNHLIGSYVTKGRLSHNTFEFSRFDVSIGGGSLGGSLSALFWPFTHPFLIE